MFEQRLFFFHLRIIFVFFLFSYRSIETRRFDVLSTILISIRIEVFVFFSLTNESNEFKMAVHMKGFDEDSR